MGAVIVLKQQHHSLPAKFITLSRALTQKKGGEVLRLLVFRGISLNIQAISQPQDT
jgi:hypothetical protein